MIVPISKSDRQRASAFLDDIKATKPNHRRILVSDADRDALEIAAKLGEVAVGKLLDLPVDWTIYKGGDGGRDFILDDNRTLDVKAIQVKSNMDYDFKLETVPEELRAELLALALVAPDRSYVDVAGYVSAKQFLREAWRTKDWLHIGPIEPLVFPRSRLRPFSELLPDHAAAA